MFFISPSSYAGVFVVPSAVADNALKTASGAFLKVILYIFRHCSESIDAEIISKNTGIPTGEVNDALLYWSGKGILTEGEPVVSATEEKTEKNTVKDTSPTEKTDENTPPAAKTESIGNDRKTIISVKPKPLTYGIICRRIDESEEVRTLFSQAEICLGRGIGTGDQSSLLLLHDYYGLPVEVILALCEYARSNGKSGNMNYIYTIGIDWSKREIDTLEEADEEFKRLQNLDKNWAPFCEITGIKRKKPTQKQSEFLSAWLMRYKFTMEMISCAFEEMSKHTDEISFPYMNKILTEWYNGGVDTPEKAKERELKFTEEKAKKKAQRSSKKSTPYGTASSADENGQTPASYDIEKAQKKAKTSVPTLKKKEKR